jgi:hypothetical protein
VESFFVLKKKCNTCKSGPLIVKLGGFNPTLDVMLLI